MKNKIVVGIVVLAAIMLVSGVTLLAAATTGTQDDPLISLSYLTNIFRPQVTTEINQAQQRAEQNFDQRIAELELMLGDTEGSSQFDPESADTFSVVTLSRNQTLVCSVGAELMLRVGTATGTGTAPALINYTDGAALAVGASLTANNMYLVTI